MITQEVEKIKAAFGDREFTGSEMARVLELPTYHGTGWRIKWLFARNMLYKTAHGYRFGTAPQVVPEAPSAPAIAPSAPPIAASEALSIPPLLVRIGEFYLHERLLLIVHTGNQEGSPAVRLYTTIIEIDPATKYPRNKIINFIKARDPREYAQTVAWLDSLAGDPHAADDTALELAAEYERQLNAARQEIDVLKARIKKISAAFAEATV